MRWASTKSATAVEAMKAEIDATWKVRSPVSPAPPPRAPLSPKPRPPRQVTDNKRLPRDRRAAARKLRTRLNVEIERSAKPKLAAARTTLKSTVDAAATVRGGTLKGSTPLSVARSWAARDGAASAYEEIATYLADDARIPRVVYVWSPPMPYARPAFTTPATTLLVLPPY